MTKCHLHYIFDNMGSTLLFVPMWTETRRKTVTTTKPAPVIQTPWWEWHHLPFPRKQLAFAFSHTHRYCLQPTSLLRDEHAATTHPRTYWQLVSLLANENGVLGANKFDTATSLTDRHLSSQPPKIDKDKSNSRLFQHDLLMTDKKRLVTAAVSSRSSWTHRTRKRPGITWPSISLSITSRNHHRWLLGRIYLRTAPPRRIYSKDDDNSDHIAEALSF